MIKHFHIPFVVCVILWMETCPAQMRPHQGVSPLGQADCTSAAQLPAPTVPNGFGVNIHFRGEPRDSDLIANAGFKFIRMDLTWEAVEGKKGIYEFEKSGYDALTKGCSERGIRILYILDYSNRLYESDRSIRTEKGRRAFAAFAEAAAARYSRIGILWEIWNEPNIKLFWRPQPIVDDYCDLVKATATVIKKADKTGLVVAPATSTIPFGWLEDCFKKGLLQWIDAMTVHPYRPKRPETVIKDYYRLRELIKRYTPQGKEPPIISGEWGYSLINWDNSRITEQQQARYLVRMFLVNLYQNVSVSIWYDWKDDGTNSNEREHHFGSMTHDLKPKAVYLAGKILSSTLAGFSFDQRLDLGSDKDFALKMTKDKAEAIAVWTIGKEHKVTPPKESGDVRIIHFLGKESKTSPTEKDSDLELTILQKPQYLLIKGESSNPHWRAADNHSASSFCRSSIISAFVGRASIEPNFVQANAPAAEANLTASLTSSFTAQ